MHATTDTDNILYGMFVENTGRHFLDSGGAYGRNWERNQSKTIQDFLDSSGSVTAYTYHNRFDAEVYVSTFHYLRDRLDYEPGLALLMDIFASEDSHLESYNQRDVYELRDGFPTWLRQRADSLYEQRSADEDWDMDMTDPEAGYDLGDFCSYMESGAIGDWSIDNPATENTYNYDNFLDQDILFTAWQGDCDAYVVLQIHGGCDARGGYTMPVPFRISGIDGLYSFLNYNRCEVFCTECAAGWSMDGPSDADPNDHAAIDNPFDLRTLSECSSDIEASVLAYTLSHDYITEHGRDENNIRVIVAPDRSVFCPCCGVGKIQAAPYPA